MSGLQTQVYEQLDKLDDYLANKNSSERAAFGFIVGIAIAALMYFALYDLSAGYEMEYRGIHDDISSKLQQENDYISSMDNGGFLTLEQQINNSQKDINQAQENLKYLQGLIDEVFVYSKDWFLTFDDASKAAVAMGLTVNGTEVEMNDTSSLGGMKYSSFVLFGYGKFSDILKYIDWLEIYGKFISIDNVIIESKDNRLNFSILIKNYRGGA